MNTLTITLPSNSVTAISMKDYAPVQVDLVELSKHMTLAQFEVLLNIFSDRIDVHTHIHSGDESFNIETCFNGSYIQINNALEREEAINLLS